MTPAPARISEDELAYHARVRGELEAAGAAWRSWLAHLAAKYGLVEGDRIEPDGALWRGTDSTGGGHADAVAGD